MRAFFGGQIQEDCRGELVAIINRGQEGSKYNVLVYPLVSEEFVHLTGVGDTKNPLERAYIGISYDAGERIIWHVSGAQIDNLRTIDKLVVTPYFLDKYLDKPDQIILRSTRDGYEIVKP
jgi:hypothetical protein